MKTMIVAITDNIPTINITFDIGQIDKTSSPLLKYILHIALGDFNGDVSPSLKLY